jgi:hypothetical protein
MNRHMFMSSVKRRLQNSGLILLGYKRAGDLIEQRLVESRELSAGIKQNYWRRGMTTSAIKIEVPNAENVTVTEDTLSVDLSDGRTISVPLAWFPRLVHATSEERDNWRLIGTGQGIHWEAIDEDISVEGLLAGKPSGESQASFKKWLSQRSLA